MAENEQDIALKAELKKIDWQKYLNHGSIKVQIRNGKMGLTTIARTYPD